MPDIPTRIERVELRCSNAEASAEFYSRLTGLEVAELGADRASLRAPGADAACVVLHQAETPGRAPSGASGLFHTAFRYPGRPGLGAALGRIAELGADFAGASDHGVSEALYLDDPDGLGIELYRDRPRGEWPEPADDERVKMFTAPLDLNDLAGAAAERSGEPGAGIDVGHVHLKVGDPVAAERFWTEDVGMDLMTRYGADAVFLGRDDYHHHIGANAWHSRGAEREPITGPGLDRVVIRADADAELKSPDGIPIDLVAV